MPWIGPEAQDLGRRKPPNPKPSSLDPCISEEAEEYLQRQDVQEALHANISGMLQHKFEGCSNYIKYSRYAAECVHVSFRAM